jgi:2-dehydrotetronate isomerase
MLRFAANLSMLYNEHAFLDRFAAAARDGFSGVEFLFPYAFTARDLAQRLSDHGLAQVLFNAPPGDWDAGERGIACLPERMAEFRTSFGKALDYAAALRCPRIHVMAGLAPATADPAALMATYTANIAWAAQQAASYGVDVLIEPINTRDMPGYFLNYQQQAHAIVQSIAAPNLKVQFDLYHCQIMEGDLTHNIRQYLPTGRVGHLQIAGVPQRHEPSLGEVNYAYIFAVIDEVAQACGWQGWVGCEYRPALGAVKGASTQGLDWLKSAPH